MTGTRRNSPCKWEWLNIVRKEKTLRKNQTDQQTWQVKVSKVNELLCKVHDNEDWHQILYWQTVKCPLNSYPEKNKRLNEGGIEDKSELTNWAHQLWNQLSRKHKHRLTLWMCFQVPWSVLEDLRKQRNKLTLWIVFRSHDQSIIQHLRKHRDRLTYWMCFQVSRSVMQLLRNTETNSLTGCVFRSHDKSCNFSGNTDRLTN